MAAPFVARAATTSASSGRGWMFGPASPTSTTGCSLSSNPANSLVLQLCTLLLMLFTATILSSKFMLFFCDVCIEVVCELLYVVDPANDLDIWLAHLVFLPCINRDLRLFRGQWNNHGLSTEHGRSPRQLFVLGMLQNHGSTLTAVRDVFDSDGVPSAGESNSIKFTCE